jgi:hypothetical protein
VHEYAELIRAIAILLWPLCALAYLIVLLVRSATSARTLIDPMNPQENYRITWTTPQPPSLAPARPREPEPKQPDLPPLE